MTKSTYIQQYNELMITIITTHNDLKLKCQLAYENAINHALSSGDWFLFADFIEKLIDNKITTGQHLFNIMKATNPKLIYSAKKHSIKQDKGFDKNATTIVESIWVDSLTGSKEKQKAVFDDVYLKSAFLRLIKKAKNQNFTLEKIKAIFESASN